MTNISVTNRATEVLDRHRVIFKPRRPGEVFALTFISRFVEADGAVVAGFSPGYSTDSVSPLNLSDMWALAQPVGAPEFVFMPKFEWRADGAYLVDMASETFELFSVAPIA